MSAFTGPLTMTQVDADWRLWRLEQPFVYEIGQLGSGKTIIVPAGFYTDGASIPRIFWALLPTWGKYSRAAVVHDYLGYLSGKGTRHPYAPDQKTADGIFLEAMAVCRVNWLVRHLLWGAVRLADRFPWLRQIGVRSADEVVGEP